MNHIEADQYSDYFIKAIYEYKLNILQSSKILNLNIYLLIDFILLISSIQLLTYQMLYLIPISIAIFAILIYVIMSQVRYINNLNDNIRSARYYIDRVEQRISSYE